MWGHGGKHARNPRSWAWAAHFPWGQPREEWENRGGRCFEIRILLSSRFGHVFLPSLSLWTAWRACYSEFPSCSYCVSVFWNPYPVIESLWSCFSAKLVAVDGLARLLLWVSILFLLCLCVLTSVARYRVVVVMFFCQACRCGRPGAPATLSFHPVLRYGSCMLLWAVLIMSYNLTSLSLNVTVQSNWHVTDNLILPRSCRYFPGSGRIWHVFRFICRCFWCG